MTNWYDLVPEQVAISQIAWERRRQVMRMLSVGLKRKDVAKRLGVCTARVAQMIRAHERKPESPILAHCKSGRINDSYHEMKHPLPASCKEKIRAILD